MTLLGAALALLSAIAWGTGDFCGGLATRRVAVVISVFAVQALGTVLALASVVATAEVAGEPHAMAWAAAGGIGGLVGVTALYLALAGGTMGLIAPLSGVIAAAVPVFIDLVAGRGAQPVALVGMLLALAALIAVSMPTAGDAAAASLHPAGRARLVGWGLTTIAGLGFAAYFLGVDRAHGEGAGTWWTLLAARGAGFLVVSGALAALALMRRLPPTTGIVAAAPVLALSALGDLGGNLFYVLALGETTLAVAVVLASLYPVMTAFLARVVLGERLTRTALVGAGLAVAGVVLIGIGSTVA